MRSRDSWAELPWEEAGGRGWKADVITRGGGGTLRKSQNKINAKYCLKIHALYEKAGVKFVIKHYLPPNDFAFSFMQAERLHHMAWPHFTRMHRI